MRRRRACLSAALALALVALAAPEGVADVTNLVSKLEKGDAAERRDAAKELAELGADAKPALAALTRALGDRDLFVRRYSAEALGAIGPDAKGAIGKLSTLMSDERSEVATAAVAAIGKMGPAGITALTAAVKDPNKDPNVRRQAARGLGNIGLQARSAVPGLTDVLTGRISSTKATKKNRKGNNDDDIRIDVATALGSVAKAEDTAAINALKSVSEGKQRNKQLQKAAGEALRKITGQAPEKAKRKKKQKDTEKDA